MFPSWLEMQRRWAHDVVKRARTGNVIIRAGTGGRSSSSGHTATVFGCTGFLGRYLVNQLGKEGTQIVTAYRGEEDSCRHLKVMGDLGQIAQLEFDPKRYDYIVECVRNSDTVFNLIGRHYETKNFDFNQVHVEIPRLVAKACRENGVSRLIHVSAHNADLNSPSRFLRSKAAGEIVVKEEFPEATIVRPVTMYGHEDRFFNRMGWLWRLPFGFPVVRTGQQLIRPVHVVDVAKGLNHLMYDESSVGKTFEFYGPKEYSYLQVVDIFRELSKRDFGVINMPKAVAMFLAKLSGPLPATWMTPDEVERMCIDDRINPQALSLQDAGVPNPHNLEHAAIEFIRRFRTSADYSAPLSDTVLSRK